METRATPLTTTTEHLHDVTRKISNISEPFSISLRQIGGTSSNQKIIFWYVAQQSRRQATFFRPGLACGLACRNFSLPGFRRGVDCLVSQPGLAWPGLAGQQAPATGQAIFVVFLL
jgi:hypothetical protein